MWCREKVHSSGPAQRQDHERIEGAFLGLNRVGKPDSGMRFYMVHNDVLWISTMIYTVLFLMWHLCTNTSIIEKYIQSFKVVFFSVNTSINMIFLMFLIQKDHAVWMLWCFKRRPWWLERAKTWSPCAWPLKKHGRPSEVFHQALGMDFPGSHWFFFSQNSDVTWCYVN